MLYESEYYGAGYLPLEGYLEHHGILGQKWGIRRFQNKDGTLTEAGKKRNKDKPIPGIPKILQKRAHQPTPRQAFNDLMKTYDIKKHAQEIKPLDDEATDYWRDHFKEDEAGAKAKLAKIQELVNKVAKDEIAEKGTDIIREYEKWSGRKQMVKMLGNTDEEKAYRLIRLLIYDQMRANGEGFHTMSVRRK